MVSAYGRRFYATKPDFAARRIEAIGFQVGRQLIERFPLNLSIVWADRVRFSGQEPSFLVDNCECRRYTIEHPRFSDHLEAIKYAKIWLELFKKQIDNLKTNHRGTFVLRDNKFCWFTLVSIDPSSEDDEASQGSSSEAANMLLHFPCGIIRGALSNVGISCAVSADASNLPSCMPSIIVNALKFFI
ncbi:hypothetical protein ZIOFF_042136 [Zingiber officinale]|uniref:Uncharacterized protein n=1 Tax=Zingiber officinale TaxID=94328 RepID=A0A8J5GJV4_ZINOF|nr:hypothetical protein ZIOFF_042136 [Zingiber officinale]